MDGHRAYTRKTSDTICRTTRALTPPDTNRKPSPVIILTDRFAPTNRPAKAERTTHCIATLTMTSGCSRRIRQASDFTVLSDLSGLKPPRAIGTSTTRKPSLRNASAASPTLQATTTSSPRTKAARPSPMRWDTKDQSSAQTIMVLRRALGAVSRTNASRRRTAIASERIKTANHHDVQNE